jgi:hypothetical protein
MVISILESGDQYCSIELSLLMDDNVVIEYMYIPLIQWVSW